MTKQEKQAPKKTRAVRFRLVPLAERDKFSFAQRLVFAILGIFVLSGIAAIVDNKEGENIFKGTLTVFPPIVTLILGYYFSQKKG